jgi:hypothetical protein
VLAFVAGVALPVLSAGILVNETLRVTVGSSIPMDAAPSPHSIRVAATALAAVGLAACIAVALDRSASRRDRRFYLLFSLLDLALSAAWAAFWVHFG